VAASTETTLTTQSPAEARDQGSFHGRKGAAALATTASTLGHRLGSRAPTRQLGDVGGYPPCLVAREQLRRRAPSWLVLEIDVGEGLTVVVTDDEAGAVILDVPVAAGSGAASFWPTFECSNVSAMRSASRLGRAEAEKAAGAVFVAGWLQCGGNAEEIKNGIPCSPDVKLLILLVRTAGLEPARGFPQGILSLFQTDFASHWVD